ncbi:MAG TPA: 30S ribosomal protein S17 [Anaerohalosphaeraceae bacterium]|jgi:small subunit ribosomal protein S17|nr:30S ribosomal protein S17 [Anaerohalosphaeraceae bacterium]
MEKEKVKTQRAVVIGKSTDKTIKVQIDFLARHPKYGKFLRRRTRLAVDDPKNLAAVGDVVEITECRPISKNKSWRLLNVVQKAVVE